MSAGPGTAERRQRLDDDGPGEGSRSVRPGGRWTLLEVLPLAIVAWWLAAAALLPPVQDEAYYFLWSRLLDFGYFDHPPLVAVLGLTHAWFADSLPAQLVPLVSRLGTVLAGIATLLLSLRLFRLVGLEEPGARTAALALSHGNVMGLVYGFLTTPDTALILCWVLALHEACAALQGKERRWLTAGAATGLGLLAKYTMLLIGPVFLWALLRARRLRSPWPYLGGLVALLVFLPNIAWNAQHDWITFRFQARHGFSLDRPDLAAVGLPSAEPAAEDGPEMALASRFLRLADEAKKEEKKPGPWDDTLNALNRYVGYYASQLALWGLLLAGVPLAWRDARRARQGAKPRHDAAVYIIPTKGQLDPRARPLLVAACAVPLVVFGLISLVSKVEANWSAMYVFAAAALLAPAFAARQRLLAAALVGHVLLLAVAVAHARSALLPTRPHRDRLLLETHGYQELAAQLAGLPGPVFADSYQTAAMARFWQPTLQLRQWPGITRVSEFLRNPALMDLDAAALRATGGFWLVQNGVVPPRLAGFVPVELALLRDCLGEPLQVMDFAAALDVQRRCRSPVHEWYLARYVPHP